MNGRSLLSTGHNLDVPYTAVKAELLSGDRQTWVADTTALQPLAAGFPYWPTEQYYSILGSR